jgi:hypothetical protein
MVPGESVYGEKRISVDDPSEEGKKIEYRVWNPFRSKIAAAVLGGVDNIWVKPGAKVLYLGAASGTSVSHVSDIVGSTGVVYAVEFSHRSGRDLINMVPTSALSVRTTQPTKRVSYVAYSPFHCLRPWHRWSRGPFVADRLDVSMVTLTTNPSCQDKSLHDSLLV